MAKKENELKMPKQNLSFAKEAKSFEEDAKKTIELTPGKVRAATIQTHFQYIRDREGEEGAKKVLEKLKELGHPIYLQKLRSLGWVPTGLADLVVIAAKEVFNWTDKDIFDLGNQAPKFSFIVRLLMKTFLSLKRTFEECPKYWEKHYTTGKLEAVEFNEKEKYLVLQLKHRCHPILCIFYTGYFLRIGQFVMPKETKMTIEETKCMSRGAPYHEFIIRWE